MLYQLLVSLLIQLFSKKFESLGSLLKTQATEIASPLHQLFKISSQLSITTKSQIILQISGQGKDQSFCGFLSQLNNSNNFHVIQRILAEHILPSCEKSNFILEFHILFHYFFLFFIDSVSIKRFSNTKMQH